MTEGTPEPLIEVKDDAGALATAVAGELLSRLADAQAAGGVPQIALTGGSIADAVHAELARLGPDSAVDWSRVVVWWGDERFVPRDSPDRNAGQARAAFLAAVGIPDECVHEVASSDDVASAEAAADLYAAALREHGAGELEVLMLGVGPDGHVASLFPGFPQLDVDGDLAVGYRSSLHSTPRPATGAP